PPFVRVAILSDAADFNLTIRGPYKIFTLRTSELLDSGKSLRKTKVMPTEAGIKIKDKDYKVFGIKIVPQAPGNIYVNNRRFRGELFIIRKENLKLLVVNNLDIEEYIKGVLRHEVSHRWPLEVLKAQAVAARTFAVYQMQISAAKDFDVTSDIYSQVYGGKASETYRTSVAVNRTRGEVLTYKGRIFPAFFHATCGGHTEDASVLWNINIPPLKGVECKFCVHSPHLKWHKEISLAEAEDKLIANGFAIGGLENIEVTERDASGRALKLKLVAAGDKLEISGKDFRQIFDPHFIRSTNFQIKNSDGKLYIQGIGWGHGVGMCQWGAYAQSLQGRKYDEILKYYYPGAVVKNLY
ncbi:MAG: SpoIID/LytB domain-containing protein, partial [Candidatus Omnitrophota bacterium]